ncbi:MAG: sterol desaturase family protein [Gammaproteobacteria bacterium]|nr:MAG: sterol desaturase family protein [Gammaproteobacteria bacterium]
MDNDLLSNEPAIRLTFFFSIFLLMALWEAVAPRRSQQIPRRIRWPNNLGIVALNIILLRLVIPATAISVAQMADTAGWGLLHHLALPVWLAFPLAILLLDLAIYLQHVMFHAVPALWRLHRVHHADLEFDVTTGARFHPVEIIASMVIKLMVIAALGPSAIAVLFFEVLLNGLAMFNHGNIRLPLTIDRRLRKIIVTPDMHRVHHSVIPEEANSNFGFNLALWDRWLGTYRAQPAHGHLDMVIGINKFRTTRDLGIDRMLMQPFRGAPDSYPINREK